MGNSRSASVEATTSETTPNQGSNDTSQVILLKSLIIGDSDTHKSALLLRFAEDEFSTSFITTIGIDFKIKTLPIGGRNVKFQVWDTAGQERFRTLTTAYFRGASAILLIYNPLNRNSFDSLMKWISHIQQYSSEDICLALVAHHYSTNDSDSDTESESPAPPVTDFEGLCRALELNLNAGFFACHNGPTLQRSDTTDDAALSLTLPVRQLSANANVTVPFLAVAQKHIKKLIASGSVSSQCESLERANWQVCNDNSVVSLCLQDFTTVSDVITALSSLQSPAEVRLLDVSHNRLQSLQIQQTTANDTAPSTLATLKQLVILDLSHNELQSLEGLDSQLSLQILNVANNKLTRLEADWFPISLRSIDISANQIADAELETWAETTPAASQLQVLIAHHNALSRLPIMALLAMTSLREAHFSFNSISSLSGYELPTDALSLNTTLEKLDLCFNQITEISEPIQLPESVTYLWLNHNKIHTISPRAFTLSHLGGTPNLRNLSLSHNELTEASITRELFATLPALEIVDLSHNKLTHVAADLVVDCTALQCLQLNDNLLTAFDDFHAPHCLRAVDLRNNQIVSTPTTAQHRSVAFKLDGNPCSK